MLRIGLKMLLGDQAKFMGSLIGITFTAFLVTFATSYFAGFMTRGFALIAENEQADVWVMDPAVDSVESTINIPTSVLNRVRSVAGVRSAFPIILGAVTARFPNGRFQSFQLIGVDDATLAGAPPIAGRALSSALRVPDAAIVDAGGTSGKLETPVNERDQWPHSGVRLHVPTRELAAGDELLINDHRIRIVGRSETLPRFPPRPLLYATGRTAAHILPPERTTITFVLAMARPGVSHDLLARRIQRLTGFRARTAAQFKADTLRWYLINSEDVGDMTAMLILAMTVGLGVTGVMLYMFTYENRTQYAVFKTMGASRGQLLTMIFFQAGSCTLVGCGLGIGLCAVIGQFVASSSFPFRMVWFTPLVGLAGVLLVGLTAAAVSIRPVTKLEPGIVFAGR